VEESLWELVKGLVENGVNMKVADNQGDTPKDLVEVKDKQEYDEAVERGRHDRAWTKHGLMLKHREQ